jgi:hypothetical protein
MKRDNINTSHMVKIQKFIFNPFQENSYVLFDETGQCIFVDMGSYTVEEKKAVLYFLENNGLSPVMIVNTHCHVDHILGNSYFKNKLRIKIAAHQGDEFILEDAVEHGKCLAWRSNHLPRSIFILMRVKVSLLAIPGSKSFMCPAILPEALPYTVMMTILLFQAMFCSTEALEELTCPEAIIIP